MTTATVGTGTITLGAAVSGYLTFAQAGVANGDVIDYAVKDGNNSEIGTGTYTASGTTLTRFVTKSTNANAALNLSGTAEVFITPRAETLADASSLTSGALDPARIGSKALGQNKIDLSSFANGGGNSNLNALLTAGFYAATGYTNSPDGAGATGNYWYVLVQQWDGASYTQQTAWRLTGGGFGGNEVWSRAQQGGAWSAWARVQFANSSSATRLVLSDPSPASTTAGIMMGFGAQGCVLTPNNSGKIFASFVGVMNGTASQFYNLRFGTGAPPANGAAATGTQVTNTAFINAGTWPAGTNAIIAGLTPGVQYWFDLHVGINAGASVSIIFRNATFSAHET